MLGRQDVRMLLWANGVWQHYRIQACQPASLPAEKAGMAFKKKPE